MTDHIISASILSADFANLGQDVNKALNAGADHVHFDVMDHHYVPNLTFGAVVCESLRKAGIEAPIDVHLMVTHPEQYFEAFAKAGANLITFHPETVPDLNQAFQRLRDLGLGIGLAFNPNQDVNVDDQVLQDLDLLLIMTVQPGFGGQKFNDTCLEKIAHMRQRLDHCNSGAWLGVDGGIKNETALKVAKAGADFMVIGSGLFHAEDYSAYLTDLREKLEQVSTI